MRRFLRVAAVQFLAEAFQRAGSFRASARHRRVPGCGRRAGFRGSGGCNGGGSLSNRSRHCCFRSGVGVVFSAARRAGMGSCVVMPFSGELELHDGIGRRDSVGNVLQYRSDTSLDCRAPTAEPARAPAGRTVRRGVRRRSSGRVGADWGVSCRVAVIGGVAYRSKATPAPRPGHPAEREVQKCERAQNIRSCTEPASSMIIAG